MKDFSPERREQFAKETIEARKKAEEIRKDEADKFAKKYISIIVAKQKQGFGLVEIAKQLNDEGHKSRRGGEWTDQTVRQILKRFPSIDDPPVTPVQRKKIIGWEKLF